MNQINIIICEDERLIALDLKNSLIKMGHNVVNVCHDGNELIRQVRSLKPHLIITDISLKGNISGIDAIKILKAEFTIPFMFLSGLKDEITYKAALDTNPCAFISKPYEYYDLKDKIDSCIAEYEITKRDSTSLSFM